MDFTILQGNLETLALVITTRIGVGERPFLKAQASVLSTEYRVSSEQPRIGLLSECYDATCSS